MAEIITTQKLIDADIDVDNLGKAANELGTVNPRYGNPYKTAPQTIQDLQQKADQVVAQGFYQGYTTEALLLAAKPAVAEMRARADDTRKIYRWNRTSAEGVTPVTGNWVDTGLSELDQAKTYADTNKLDLSKITYEYVGGNLIGPKTLRYQNYGYTSAANGLREHPSLDSIIIPVNEGDMLFLYNYAEKYLASEGAGIYFFEENPYSNRSQPPVKQSSYNVTDTETGKKYVIASVPVTANYLLLHSRFSTSIVVDWVVHNGYFSTSREAINPHIFSIEDERVSQKKKLDEAIGSYLRANLFEQLQFENVNTTSYLATVTKEDFTPVLNVDIRGPSSSSTVVYEYPLSEFIKVGDILSFSASIMTDLADTSSEISLRFLNSTRGTISTRIATPTKTNEWERLVVSNVVPNNATRVALRFVRWSGATTSYVKFKEPLLQSSSWFARNTPRAPRTLTRNHAFVSKTGSDDNDGSFDYPYLTIQAAVNSLPVGGGVTILDSGWYREAVEITSPYKFTINSATGKRGKIVGSNQLIVTKTPGYTKVYQASLAAKPDGASGRLGGGIIAEWGTKSLPIDSADVHAIQRGQTHYLPYTEMYEAASKSELDTLSGDGKWWWESGVIYFAATDGSDATLKQYESRIRIPMTHQIGEIECENIDFLFSMGSCFSSSGRKVTRRDCVAYGGRINGFSDNAKSTLAFRDIAAGNRNDGANGTVPLENTVGTENLETTLHATYYDPWYSVNGDDGCSFHIRGTCIIYGGLIEYNTGNGVVHVTGGGGSCYLTISRGNMNGFHTNSAAVGGRNKSSMHCYGTISERNDYNYSATGETEIHCIDAKAINPNIFGYSGNIYATDCKYMGDPAKAKNGNVVVQKCDDLA